MNSKPLVVVSGRNGQLGWEIERQSADHADLDFRFFDRDELDITNEVQLEKLFDQLRPAVFINCAAYTAVDKAETDQVAAYRVNAEAPGLIANLCRIHRTKFLHYSTDYVFDGMARQPYKTDDATDPINYYGYTKWMGEQLARKNHDACVIIRTSWVYSSHGNNFVKTMLRLMDSRSDLNVVDDQVGSPTYAADLAAASIQALKVTLDPLFKHYGIYHYSNEGVISWYQFAQAIREMKGKTTNLHPIPTSGYPTPAKRPSYSVMDTSGITASFGVHARPWKDSLQDCLSLL